MLEIGKDAGYDKKSVRKAVLIGTGITLLAVSSGCLASVHANEGYTDAKVKDKFIDTGGEKGSHYVVVTDKGNFEVDRPMADVFNGERNPDLVWSQIKTGEKYKLHHYGYRIDLLYDYPIVVGVEPLE